jgi:glucosamine-6-phosphate deaminase
LPRRTGRGFPIGSLPEVELIQVADAADLAETGAAMVAARLSERAHPALLAAMGETPLGLYAGLARRRAEGQLDTARLRLVQLDAYLGIDAGDPRSLGSWLIRAVAAPLGIPDARLIRLPGDSPDPAATCRAYDAAVAEAGGLDVAVLGLGPNGHLGFNEPPSDAGAPTRIVELSEASIASNARYWGGRLDVPRQALTAGMPILLAARHPLLVVSGATKRDILRRVLKGPVGPMVPATYLREVAASVVIADRAALGTRAA